MNWRRVGIGIILVAVLSVAGYFGYQQFLAPQDEEADAATPAADDIALVTDLDSVSAEGQIVPLAQAQLAFQGSGAVVDILVDIGDDVAVGDALVRLDAVDQEIALQQAQAALGQVEANLQAAEAGLGAAQAGLVAAEAGVAVAEAQLALTTAEPSAAQVALSEANVDVSAAGVTQAAGNQAVVAEGPTSAQIQAAEARLAAAQAPLFSARLANEPVAQNEDADEAAREQAALRLAAAQRAVDAAQSALNELGATSDELLAANSAVGAAANQRDAAEAELALLLAGARPEQVTITEVSVTAAQSAVAEAELSVAEAETAVTQAEAALAEAEAAVAAAQIALDRRTLSAPFAGVVADVPVKISEVVAPGVPAVILADFSEWHIETTDLTELGVVNVARGFDVEITIDAFPGETLQGEVVDIAEVSDVVRGDVTYITTIALTETPPAGLRWGMTAFVTIPTGQ